MYPEPDAFNVNTLSASASIWLKSSLYGVVTPLVNVSSSIVTVPLKSSVVSPSMAEIAFAFV